VGSFFIYRGWSKRWKDFLLFTPDSYIAFQCLPNQSFSSFISGSYKPFRAVNSAPLDICSMLGWKDY
jgi:hypothetical protein